ncbi:hypothetical protein HD806DRAFT_519030 [Xylariaceae sp. AK1471]|nr:hypothetical protein HD806DRAFT_519030 [Xylariaceae sp. AK1471]
MASDTTHAVEPKAAHTHTVIFLHGRDSDCKEFANELVRKLFESEASESIDQPRRTLDLFPTIRWRFETNLSQWFDMWSSIKQIPGTIKGKEKSVSRGRIFRTGISQGFATMIATFFADARGGFAELIGLCSWMPVALRTQDLVVIESIRKTPIFLSHSVDVNVVPIKEYEDGGHWINEPQGVDDIVRFINSHMAA